MTPRKSLAAILSAALIPAAAAAQQEIKVGGIFDLTGVTSDVGKPFAQGVQDCVAVVNDGGGIGGKKVKLIAADYAYKIDQARALYKKLVNDDKVVMIDQTRLPGEEVYNEYTDFQGVAEAIRGMIIRGAPAIGVAAAMGVALGARDIIADTHQSFFRQLDNVCDVLAATRPTAVNLCWALERMHSLVRANALQPVANLKIALEYEALAIAEEDLRLRGPGDPHREDHHGHCDDGIAHRASFPFRSGKRGLPVDDRAPAPSRRPYGSGRGPQ